MEIRAPAERTDTGRNEWSPGSFSLRMVALGRARSKMAAGTLPKKKTTGSEF